MHKISVIIPTYKRIKDLTECLDSIWLQYFLPSEILVVDNEKSQFTEKVVMEKTRDFETKGIRLLYLSNTLENSLTVARNLGVRHVKGDLISFLDDDVILFPEYYQEIIKIFDLHPACLGVCGFPVYKLTSFEKIAMHLLNPPARFFYQNHHQNKNLRLFPSLGVTNPYPENQKRRIFYSQWSSGASSTFKKEVFQEFSYDENLKKYCWGEDTDFGYRIHKKYPDSLIFNLDARYIHKISPSGRIASKEVAYMEEVYYLYLFYKLFNPDIKNRMIYLWGRIGRIIFKIFFLFHSRRPFKLMDIVYSLQAYYYCLKHLDEIKKGELVFFNKTIK